MRTPRFFRVVTLSLTFVSTACGGSGSTGNPGTAGSGAAGSDGGAAGTVGGAGTGGSSGTSGGQSGAFAGSDGGGAGQGGSAGGMDSGAAGSDGGADTAANDGSTTDATDTAMATEGGTADVVDAGPVDLCAPITIGAPPATVTNINNGKAVDPAAFTGGTIPSGTYYLTSVTHFGVAYTGPTREIWVIDPPAKTLADAALTGTTSSYAGYAVSNSAPSVLAGVATCGATGTLSWNYVVSGGMLSVNPRGSSDVKIFTMQ
jgi:hypothetical protein